MSIWKNFAKQPKFDPKPYIRYRQQVDLVVRFPNCIRSFQSDQYWSPNTRISPAENSYNLTHRGEAGLVQESVVIVVHEQLAGARVGAGGGEGDGARFVGLHAGGVVADVGVFVLRLQGRVGVDAEPYGQQNKLFT